MKGNVNYERIIRQAMYRALRYGRIERAEVWTLAKRLARHGRATHIGGNVVSFNGRTTRWLDCWTLKWL